MPGRNEPCPCGSELKYKRCCQGLEAVSDANETLRFGGLAPEEFIALDQDAYERACELDRRGQLLLNSGEYERALALFDEAITLVPSMTFWRNNRALALMMLGRLESAMVTCVYVVDEIDGSNVFARSLLIQCADLLDDESLVDEHLVALEAVSPSDPSALVKALETFGKLGRHVELLAYADEHRGMCDRAAAFYTGIAAANVDDQRRAIRDLKRAAKDSLEGQRANTPLRQINRGQRPPTLDGSFPYGSTGGALVPPGFFERVMDDVRQAIETYGLDEARGALAPEHVPAHADALIRFVRAELDAGVEDGESLLGIPGLLGTPASIELLRQLAKSSFGTQQLRMQALFRLQTLGVVAGDESVPMLVDGKPTTVRTVGLHLDPEAIPEALPADDHQQMGRAARALNAGDLKSAETAMLDLMSRYPEHPVVRQNYAAVLGRLDHLDAAIELQIGTLDRTPHYLPARTTLMLAYIDAGAVDDARELLARYEVPERVQPTHYASFLSAQAMLALHDVPPNIVAAKRMLDMAEQIDPEAGTSSLTREFIAQLDASS